MSVSVPLVYDVQLNQIVHCGCDYIAIGASFVVRSVRAILIRWRRGIEHGVLPLVAIVDGELARSYCRADHGCSTPPCTSVTKIGGECVCGTYVSE